MTRGPGNADQRTARQGGDATMDSSNETCGTDCGGASEPETPETEITRRAFAKGVAGLLGATALTACDSDTLRELTQRRLHELSRVEVRELLARLEREYRARFANPNIQVRADPAMEGVKFAYALDLSRCIGCRRCVHACVQENNQSRPSADDAPHNNPIQWIRVLELDKEKGVDLVHANAYYNPDEVPREGHFYMPTACHHCDNAPCVKVCPVEATWQEPDGIVVIDYDWCIGCRYCMAACPYGARRFNFATPSLQAHELNTNVGYLSNRPRPRGVVEKCHFCLHRTRNETYPACVEACPTGARKFGDLNDPDSDVSRIVKDKRVFVLKEELQTLPRLFYYFD